MTETIHFLDYGIIGVYLLTMLVIGWRCSRKNASSDEYFMARSEMPGWATGFSLMATMISSMSFLATPGFAFKENWRYIPTNFLFLVAAIMGIYIFMPIFRRSGISSGYEYLERRFGSWARVYTAVGYVLMQSARLGLVTYTVSLPLQILTGLPLPLLIVLVGVVVAAYTIAGGLRAVIWTDMVQGIGLMIGALICVPIVLKGIPGGVGELFSVAHQDGKLSLGDFDFTIAKITFWVMILPAIFNQLWCVEQATIQRYVAPKTEREAKKAIWLGVLMVIPIWGYFSVLGTGLYVFYKLNPDPQIGNMVAEQVLPYFILTKIPAGLAGVVIIGLLAAAQSSLSSSISASASIVTTDFYRRFFVKDRDELHYLTASRWVSAVFGVVMIGLALLIYYIRTMTIQDLNTLIQSIFSCGIFGLFMLGILTKRVENRAALSCSLVTLAIVVGWLFIDARIPSLAGYLPHKFWMPILTNIFLFISAWITSGIIREKRHRDLKNLTLKTLESDN